MKIPNKNWIRPPGPPFIWRIISAKEKQNDGTFTDELLSIQDIPEDRYEEALDHMCQYFLRDEALNKCLRVIDDESGVKDNRILWNHCLKQTISIGAFKLNSNGELGILVAMNVLFVSNDESQRRVDEITANFKSFNAKKMYMFIDKVTNELNVRKIYGVDKYLYENGLSVKPEYRGQKLGVHFLDVWTDISRKYGIHVALICSTGPASRFQAERAGFETLVAVKYAEVLDENGRPLFPNVEADALRLMTKKM